MKILLDMNLSRKWASYLVESGFEAIHWEDLGPGNAPDVRIMEYARLNGYLVLTQDLDFGAILAATGGIEPSVVQLRTDDLSPAAIGHMVLSALTHFAEELRAGALITIDLNRIRASILPLRTD